MPFAEPPVSIPVTPENIEEVSPYKIMLLPRLRKVGLPRYPAALVRLCTDSP
ncbi:MAG TPA: hypothetical protein VFQ35_07820 [Polyangiaceae bacterium]|nr:hypothetical protein [Polyangiaceae bacterium]